MTAAEDGRLVMRAVSCPPANGNPHGGGSYGTDGQAKSAEHARRLGRHRDDASDWRKWWDSNPRTREGHTLSKRAGSAALAHFHFVSYRTSEGGTFVT